VEPVASTGKLKKKTNTKFSSGDLKVRQYLGDLEENGSIIIRRGKGVRILPGTFSAFASQLIR
jgi:hypothetical protein